MVTPVRRRLLPILAVLLGAPITAEFLQAYLSFTGDPLAMLGGLLFFAPLYSAAVLLIREVAVRTGRGWPGVLLLAAAFGVAMTGIIDLSLFGERRDDIAYWSELRDPTLLRPLGISVYATLTWVAGHVVMSVGVPLALLDRFAPAQRGLSLLGKVGLPVTAVAFVITAAMVHFDGRQIYGYAPSAGQVVGVLAVIMAFTAVALSPLGRPLEPKSIDGQRIGIVWIVAGSVTATLLPAPFPPTWVGVIAEAAVLVAAAVTIGWLSAQRDWSAREIGVLASGAVVGATLLGFLNPTPDGVSSAAKIAQNVVLLTLALALTAATIRRPARSRAVT